MSIRLVPTLGLGFRFWVMTDLFIRIIKILITNKDGLFHMISFARKSVCEVITLWNLHCDLWRQVTSYYDISIDYVIDYIVCLGMQEIWCVDVKLSLFYLCLYGLILRVCVYSSTFGVLMCTTYLMAWEQIQKPCIFKRLVNTTSD